MQECEWCYDMWCYPMCDWSYRIPSLSRICFATAQVMEEAGASSEAGTSETRDAAGLLSQHTHTTKDAACQISRSQPPPREVVQEAPAQVAPAAGQPLQNGHAHVTAQEATPQHDGEADEDEDEEGEEADEESDEEGEADDDEKEEDEEEAEVKFSNF